MSNVGFDCPHDSYKWDQAPAPGGVGIVIVGRRQAEPTADPGVIREEDSHRRCTQSAPQHGAK